MPSNTITSERTLQHYSFLSRLRPNRENCSLAGGTFYEAATAAELDDCVVEFGVMGMCPSWEVHGMAHSRDLSKSPEPVFTYIPYVNYSSISDPCGGDGEEKWYGITCEAYEDDAKPHETANLTVTQLWLYSNNLQGAIPPQLASLTSLRSQSDKWRIAAVECAGQFRSRCRSGTSCAPPRSL